MPNFNTMYGLQIGVWLCGVYCLPMVLNIGVSVTPYILLNSPSWLQDVSIREDIKILHQNLDLPIIWLTRNQDDTDIV